MLICQVRPLVFLLPCAVLARGDQFHVPAELPTIQACLDAAADGDECIVAPGAYPELINFLGKAVVLRSQSGSKVTTIDGTGLNGSVVTCVSGEGPDSVLEGFTITGGTGTWVNKAIFLGGGMYVKGAGPTVTDCAFEDNTADAGGGLYNDIDSYTLVSGCTFQDNHAAIRGGGIYSNSTITVEDSEFIGNSSDADAGAIRNFEGSLTIRRTTFTGNTAAEFGGAVAILVGIVLVEDCAFNSNSAGFAGGAIWWVESFYPYEPFVRRTSFSGNSATDGGGIGGQNVFLHLASCTFERNSALQGGGAIFWAAPNGAIICQECQFIRNTAADGGGIRLDGYGPVQLLGSKMHGNIATSGGGAINATYGSEVIAVNTVISGNAAELGGAIFASDADIDLVNSSLHGNGALVSGGAIHVAWHSWIQMVNAVLWGNQAPSGEQVLSAYPQTVWVIHSDIEGTGGSASWEEGLGQDLGGNIDADPQFAREPHPGDDGTWGTADDDYGDAHLLPGSPCINMGDDRFEEFFLDLYVHLKILTDFEGDDRVQACKVDIGADESPFAPDVDCNGNGVTDACDIEEGPSFDCNDNGIPDECDLMLGSGDCNGNGIPDECEEGGDTGSDCNGNGILDACETFQPVMFVDASSPPGGDGRSWATAFRDLQQALAYAPCDTVVEIRVAQGTYTPGIDREDTFQLSSGAALLGGFAGFAADDPDARNPREFESILSGDIGVPGDQSDNSYTVIVTGSGVDHTAVLDGFTIAYGSATGGFNYVGAGMRNFGGSPMIRNCRFYRNQANGVGGAIWNNSANPMLEDCIFEENVAKTGGAVHNLGGSAPEFRRSLFIRNVVFDPGILGRGGAIFNELFTSSRIIECTFLYNESKYSGGAITNESDQGEISGCLFLGNRAWYGGGLVEEGSAELRNCVFVGNHAEYGGAISFVSTSTIAANCTMVHNTASAGGGAIDCRHSSPQLINSILQGNSVPQVRLATGSSLVRVSFSDTDITMPGMSDQGGNINLDPHFSHIPDDGGDGWGDDPDTMETDESANDDFGDLRLLPDSPCINAGDPDHQWYYHHYDPDGHRPVLCDRIDMGAYESGIADEDCDGFVDLSDFAAMAPCVTGPGTGLVTCEPFRFDADGDVDLRDYRAFLGVFSP